jgi:hypothetical protein
MATIKNTGKLRSSDEVLKTSVVLGAKPEIIYCEESAPIPQEAWAKLERPT